MTIKSICSLLLTMDPLNSHLIWGEFDIKSRKVTLGHSFSPHLSEEHITQLFNQPHKIGFIEKFYQSSLTHEINVFNISVKGLDPTLILWIDYKTQRDGVTQFLGYPLNSQNLSISLESIVKHETLFSHFSGILCFLNNMGEIERINDKGLKTLGFTGEEVIEESFEDLLITPQTLQKIEELQKRREYDTSVEICLRRKDGSHFMGLASLNRIPDTQENLLYYTIFVIDITDQVNLIGDSMKASMDLLDSNEYLKKTQTTLLKTERMASIGVLGAGLAHEINNPLSYMLNNMTLCKEYLPSFQSYLEQVRKSSHYVDSGLEAIEKQMELDYILDEMGTMIHEMGEGLNQIGKIVHSLKSFSGQENCSGWNYEDVNKAITEMLLICNNEYKYTTVVQTNFGEIPRILCNLPELNQALLAVFLNSVQSITERLEGAQGGVIILTTELIEEEQVGITVRDNGVPIENEIKDRLYEPFFSGWKRNPGSGMGLTVTRDTIVNNHEGEIEITSNPEGTTVKMIIPLKNNHEELI